jgi:outer membrane lipoprotein-sorting protein
MFLDKLYPKLELKGIEKVGADDAYVVVAMPDNLPTETFYFDTKSGLLVRQDTTSISPEGKTAGKTFFEDYRAVDGVKVPFKTRTILPQFEIVTTFTEVKNNVAVEDSRFVKPKA